MPADSPFASFWMGGFEAADHVNAAGRPLDMAALSGHVDQLEDDHARAAALGIGSVRETIGWRLAEPARGRHDLRRTRRIAASARRHGLQVVWTLMHYGTPPDVRLTDDAAIDRFAAFARAVAREIAPRCDAPPVYNPVNEISFLAWAVSGSDMVHPYRPDRADAGAAATSVASGYEIKRRLVRMALAAIDAIREVDPRARFLHVEPLVHVVAPAGRPELAALATHVSAYQWQAWDLLCGLREPALGGTPEALDLIGINHYHSSQWEAVREERLLWHLRDARRLPFGELVAACWARYRRPMIVAETSHFGEGRPQWLHEIAAEVERVRGLGLPLQGLCLYPLVDRPDWHDPAHWHDSGLWDVDRRTPALRRVLVPDYAAALAAWQARLPLAVADTVGRPLLLVFSHLRWDFLFQRPQQLLTRLAGRYRVLFVEEPVLLGPDDGPARVDRIARGPDIDVLLPRTHVDAPGFDDAHFAVLQPLLAALLGRPGERERERIAWLCTPLALPLAASLAPDRVVYDCFDELAAFERSPAAMRARDIDLLRDADLVLASGPTLARAKAARAAGTVVRCVPNGVDATAFGAAALDAGSAQANQARLRQPDAAAGPRLGYCGAVDERLDLALLGALADARRDWQIVVAGPVVKIDPATLPQRPNLHWIGHQPPARLPYLIDAWDVCLMPFVQSPLTRAMNPVKALEYLAAGKPVVSTPVPDIAELHPETVRIAASVAGFVAACDAALHEPAAERRQRLAAARDTVARASWDDRAAEVAALLGELRDASPTPRRPLLAA